MSDMSTKDWMDIEDDLRKQLAAGHAELAELVRAAGAFLVKMNEVHQHHRYRRVWETAQVVDGPYDGPTYIDEHEALCIALRKAGAR